MESQQELCSRVKAGFMECSEADKLGIALETIGKIPIHGLRYKAENGTCGWYIWCGEKMLQSDDFFKPIHVAHIDTYLPQVKRYLGLAPGHRFLLAEGYEDVWYDATLLAI